MKAWKKCNKILSTHHYCKQKCYYFSIKIRAKMPLRKKNEGFRTENQKSYFGYVYLHLSQVGTFFFPKRKENQTKPCSVIAIFCLHMHVYETPIVFSGSHDHMRAEFLPYHYRSNDVSYLFLHLQVLTLLRLLFLQHLLGLQFCNDFHSL